MADDQHIIEFEFDPGPSPVPFGLGPLDGSFVVPQHCSIRSGGVERRVSTGDVLQARVEGGRLAGLLVNGRRLEEIGLDS